MDVLLDCDPGIDDATGMLFALKTAAIELRAITCPTGNLVASQCAANALKILDVMDAPDIPVAVGTEQPLVRRHAVDPFSHGGDGLGDTELPVSSRSIDKRFAPDLIIDTVAAYPDGLIVIATAPLTNLALALTKAPRIAGMIEHVYMIGGAYGFNEYAQLLGTGTTPLSEWNILVDPEAAQIVFRSGVPLTAMGVDVWTQPAMCFTDDELAELKAAGTPEAQLVARFVDFVESRGYGRYCAQIDSLAMVAALEPELLSIHEVGIGVETMSPLTLGMTVVERRLRHAWTDLPRIRAAYNVDFDRYRRVLVDALVA